MYPVHISLGFGVVLYGFLKSTVSEGEEKKRFTVNIHRAKRSDDTSEMTAGASKVNPKYA